MKIRKIFKISLITLPTILLGMFIYTRFLLPQYLNFGSTLYYKGHYYIAKNELNEADQTNIGGIVGIGVPPKRSITDYIWPVWIYGYRNDTHHTKLFIHGVMDLGTVFEEQ